MTSDQKLAVDGGLVAWSWTFPYTLSQANELVQIVAGVLTIVLVIIRIYVITVKDNAKE